MKTTVLNASDFMAATPGYTPVKIKIDEPDKESGWKIETKKDHYLPPQ